MSTSNITNAFEHVRSLIVAEGLDKLDFATIYDRNAFPSICNTGKEADPEDDELLFFIDVNPYGESILSLRVTSEKVAILESILLKNPAHHSSRTLSRACRRFKSHYQRIIKAQDEIFWTLSPAFTEPQEPLALADDESEKPASAEELIDLTEPSINR